MARSYDPPDVIQLPRLDIAGSLALVNSLIAAARGQSQPLPGPIAKACTQLEACGKALHDVAVTQRQQVKEKSAAAVALDRALDLAWSAVHDWTSGWSKHPGEHGARATKIRTALFADGLKFTQLPYRLEWSESEIRLSQIEQGQLAQDFRALGGDPLLDSLKSAHQAYGAALGVTEATPSEPIAPSAREPFDALIAAMKTYVLRVAAHVDADDAASGALAQALLQPLTDWRGRETRAGASGHEAAPPSPATGGETTRA